MTHLKYYYPIFILLLTSCISGPYAKYYEKQAPTTYEPTKNVTWFDYGSQDIDTLYQSFYSDFFIMGKSEFSGYISNVEKAKKVAQKVGADVVITCRNYKETKTVNYTISTPTSSTTYVRNSSGQTIGSATTYGTQQSSGSYNYDVYLQQAYYLKNVKNIVPLWERKKDYYECSEETGEFGGIWHDDNYFIQTYRSEDKILGFIVSSNYKQWLIDEPKFIFDVNTNEGVYFCSDRTPWFANFKINQFGYLEVNLKDWENISFMKNN